MLCRWQEFVSAVLGQGYRLAAFIEVFPRLLTQPPFDLRFLSSFLGLGESVLNDRLGFLVLVQHYLCRWIA